MADGGGGQGGLGVGCVDIVVSRQSLGDTEDWTMAPLPGGVWRTASGIHVGWTAYRFPAQGGDSRAWIFLATYDPTTAALKKLRRYDVFPAALTSSMTGIEALSGSDSEIFAASLRWVGAAQTVFLGRLDDDASQTQVELAWQFSPEDVSHITWDGEAFAVHAMLNSTGELFVARVSPDGQLILPSSKYGVTPSSGLEYRLSTDPVTGTTYLFDVALASLLSGHDRSGQALPWAPGKPFNIMIPGINEGGGSPFNPGLAADTTGGAWVAWSQSYNPDMISVAAHLTINGQIDRSVVFAPQPADRIPAVSATASSKVWIAQKMNNLINMFEINESNAVLRRVLLEDPYDKGEVFATYMDTRAMSGFDWKDERWLSFSEERTNVPVVFHVLRVDGNCRYSPATRPARM